LKQLFRLGKKNLTLEHVAIKTNSVDRPSRLFKSNWSYVINSIKTIFKLFILYEPMRFFSFMSIPFFLFGMGLWIRYLIMLFLHESLRGAYIQSVIVGGISILIAIFLWCLGLIGELLGKNRALIEKQLYFQKKYNN